MICLRKILLSGTILLLCVSAAALRGKDSVSSAFGNMARNIRMNRHVEDQLEEQTRILEYAVRRQQLTPSEKRRIQSMMKRVERSHERARKRGSMTPQEAKNLRQQISRIYRTLWMLRINDAGKRQTLSFLGKKIVLRQPYRRKLHSSSLDQEEIKKILHTYYKACRVREELKETRLSQRDKQRIKEECFSILSEYFTLASETSEKTPARSKGKKGK